MRPTTVCFDLDDTLYPYADYARTGLSVAAERVANRLDGRSGSEVAEELHDLYFDEDVTAGTFDRLVQRHDLPAELVDDLVEAYHGASDPLAPYDETVPTLRGLADDGYRLGLVTDGRNGDAKLRRLGIGDYFEAVVVTPEHGCSKHGREPFDKVLSELSAEPERTVYVGDDPRVDFAVPNHLGMGTVRLRRGRYVDLAPPDDAAAPDAEIDALSELPDLLDVASTPPSGEPTRSPRAHGGDRPRSEREQGDRR